MDGSGSGQKEMQSPPVSTPCRRTGCGFYAHHLFDGMCSKCYKDLNEPMEANTTRASSATTSSNNNSSINITIQPTQTVEVSPASSNNSTAAAETSIVASLPSVVRKDSTSSTPSVSEAKSDLDQVSASDTASSPSKEKTKKKRCHICKKRVGLTGFDCRCGGHYCSVHRYSDMHGCSFDYHELAQSEIRRQNPVVAAEKIKKI